MNSKLQYSRMNNWSIKGGTSVVATVRLSIFTIPVILLERWRQIVFNTDDEGLI